jgi:hypothetical protein
MSYKIGILSGIFLLLTGSDGEATSQGAMVPQNIREQSIVGKGLFCHKPRRGPRGRSGKQGETGKKGKRGKMGDRGPQGPVGLQGPQGATGPSGATRTPAYAAAHFMVDNEAIYAPAGSLVPLVNAIPPTEETPVGVSFDNTTHAFLIHSPGVYDIDYYVHIESNHPNEANASIKVLFTGSQSGNEFVDLLDEKWHPTFTVGGQTLYASEGGTRHMQRRLQIGDTVSIQVVYSNGFFYAASGAPLLAAYMTLHKISE